MENNLDKICKECGLCELIYLANERDKVRGLLEWIFKLVREYVRTNR